MYACAETSEVIYITEIVLVDLATGSEHSIGDDIVTQEMFPEGFNVRAIVDGDVRYVYLWLDDDRDTIEVYNRGPYELYRDEGFQFENFMSGTGTTFENASRKMFF